MTKKRKELGQWGEGYAKNYLINNGYQLIDQNWRNHRGEIDLIMSDGEIIVFIEVRTKTNNQFGNGIESINYRKRIQIKKMALFYLQYKNWWAKNFRFDLVAINKPINKEEIIEVIHLKNIEI